MCGGEAKRLPGRVVLESSQVVLMEGRDGFDQLELPGFCLRQDTKPSMMQLVFKGSFSSGQ